MTALYPRPIKDWTKADQYPASDDLNLDEWAWEFLRRNPEYQRLYDLFESLPDYMVLDDGSKSVKNGKFKGTMWGDMRFLTNECAFYADPPPIKGETIDEYEERTGGDPMPFADYLCKRFKLLPFPVSPIESLDDNCWFSDEWKEDSIAPWPISLTAEHLEWALDRHEKNPNRVAIVFDISQPITKQLKEAEGILKYIIEENESSEWGIPDTESSDSYKRISVRLNEYPKYIRILDAIATNCHLEEPELIKLLADTLHPNESNVYPDYPVSKKIRKNINEAKSLRDDKYQHITT